jgi:hypothetical protein
VLALAGCAGAPPVRDGTLSSGSPAPVAGYDWLLSDDGTEARLAYGQAASDDVQLALSCVPASGRLTLSRSAPDGITEIHLESGGETERFAAASEPSGIHDGAFLTASATTGAPVFQRFRSVGWMAVLEGDHRTPLVAQPASAPDIARFFVLCG